MVGGGRNTSFWKSPWSKRHSCYQHQVQRSFDLGWWRPRALLSQYDPPRSSEFDGVNWATLRVCVEKRLEPCSPLEVQILLPGVPSLCPHDPLIKGSFTLWATYGTAVAPVCAVRKALTAQRTWLWKGLKGYLETAVPRVRGERAQRGLADSRSEVVDKTGGTPKP